MHPLHSCPVNIAVISEPGGFSSMPCLIRSDGVLKLIILSHIGDYTSLKNNSSVFEPADMLIHSRVITVYLPC